MSDDGLTDLERELLELCSMSPETTTTLHDEMLEAAHDREAVESALRGLVERGLLVTYRDVYGGVQRPRVGAPEGRVYEDDWWEVTAAGRQAIGTPREGTQSRRAVQAEARTAAREDTPRRSLTAWQPKPPPAFRPPPAVDRGPTRPGERVADTVFLLVFGGGVCLVVATVVAAIVWDVLGIAGHDYGTGARRFFVIVSGVVLLVGLFHFRSVSSTAEDLSDQQRRLNKRTRFRDVPVLYRRYRTLLLSIGVAATVIGATGIALAVVR